MIVLNNGIRVEPYEPRINRYITQMALPAELITPLLRLALSDDSRIYDKSKINFFYCVDLKSKNPAVKKLCALLSKDIVDENKFGILFYYELIGYVGS